MSRKWQTREGKKIGIRSMTDSHVVNSLNFLYRRLNEEAFDEEERPIYVDTSETEDWIKRFQKELKRRKLTTEEHLNYEDKFERERCRLSKLIESRRMVPRRSLASSLRKLLKNGRTNL